MTSFWWRHGHYVTKNVTTFSILPPSPIKISGYASGVEYHFNIDISQDLTINIITVLRQILQRRHSTWRGRSTTSAASGIYEEIGPVLPDRPIKLREKKGLMPSTCLEGTS